MSKEKKKKIFKSFLTAWSFRIYTLKAKGILTMKKGILTNHNGLVMPY